MRTRQPSAAPQHIHALEPRRLLSLTPVGDETILSPGTYDVAAADDGSYIVVTGGVAHRFGPDGQPRGTPLARTATPSSPGSSSKATTCSPSTTA
jgi:hypothetical protein